MRVPLFRGLFATVDQVEKNFTLPGHKLSFIKGKINNGRMTMTLHNINYEVFRHASYEL